LPGRRATARRLRGGLVVFSEPLASILAENPSMRRTLLVGLASLSLLSFAASSAVGKIVVRTPNHLRLVSAKAVVVGKVTAIEDRTIKAPRWVGDTEMAEYHIAVVKIDEALLGAKGLTHIKVAFLPDGPGSRGDAGRKMNLATGAEVCLLLWPHTTAPYYQPHDSFDVLHKTSPDFAQQVETFRKVGKALTAPMAGLKAKTAEERYLTAAMLVYRYGLQNSFKGRRKLEAIPAEESKLILEALAGADWGEVPGRNVHPENVFTWLHPTARDGWTPPADFRKEREAMKRWCKGNAGKFRVQRYVPAEK
jgi:hypothetical protein